MQFSRTQAFTLIEVLITVGILAIIVGVGLLNLTGFKSKHSFDLDAENIVAAIRNAQNRALLGEEGKSWGIQFENGATQETYEIFSGSSYASSTTALQDSLSVSTLFTNPPSGDTKSIVFSSISGLPTKSEIVVLDRSTGNDLYIISVNSLGRVSVTYETGLVGYWSFDEGEGTLAHDHSGNGNSATFQNAPVWESSCKSGGCIELDGTSSHLTFTSPTIVGADDLTVSFWMNPDALSGETVIGSLSTYTREVQIEDANTLELNLGEAGVHNHFDITSTFQIGVWQHVAVTKSTAGAVKVYLNGDDVTLGSPTISNVTDINWNLIGSEKNSASAYFDGTLDDIRIYNRLLTATEIEQLYESY